jgi:site-specific DNA-methyltransferase (adenine-specific)|nr:MAG TPA: adenine specific DNA methyltransferase [Caudoviricetes sp.]
MEITKRRLADIVPYAANAKKHDKRQINNVAESIKQYGFVQPIVIDRDGVIVIGHCRALAAKKLGMGRQDFQWKHEPCLYGESEIEEDAHEPCLYGWTEGKKHYFFKNRRQTTVLNFDKPVKSAEHPTMKPIKLFDYQMQCSSKPGENVLDLFAGSGTTIMAAEQNGRHAFCMEYDPKYADVIVDRWEKFTGKKAVLLND